MFIPQSKPLNLHMLSTFYSCILRHFYLLVILSMCLLSGLSSLLFLFNYDYYQVATNQIAPILPLFGKLTPLLTVVPKRTGQYRQQQPSTCCSQTYCWSTQLSLCSGKTKQCFTCMYIYLSTKTMSIMKAKGLKIHVEMFTYTSTSNVVWMTHFQLT